jgi:hypothetical protein
MKNHILVNSPGGSLILRGVEFKVSPIVLRTAGIDLILGMDWMMQQQAEIQYKGKSVVLTTLKRDRIRVDVKVQKQETTIVNQLNDGANKEDKVVEEFSDVFPEKLSGMPPDRDIEFIIELLPGTAPIAKRPYRMGVDELEELKKQIKEL